MQKTRKFSKSTFAVLALSIVLAVSLIVGATFAWFNMSKSTGSGTITMATFDLVLEDAHEATDASANIATDIPTNLVPNQLVDLDDLTLNVTSNSAVCLRLSVTLTDTNSLLTTDGIEISAVDSKGGIWYKHTDDKWYRMEGPVETYYEGYYENELDTDEIVVHLQFRVDSEIEEGMAGETATFTVTVEMCQAGWTGVDATDDNVPSDTTQALCAAAIATIFTTTAA